MIGRALPRADYAGGVSGQMHLLAHALVHRGHHVTVFALNPPATTPAYHFSAIPIPGWLQSHARASLYLVSWFAGRLRFDEFDVVHAHGDDHFLRTPRPVVRTFYGAAQAEARHSTQLRHRFYHWSMVPFERMAERRATQIVAISSITQSIWPVAPSIIPCGYDPELFFAAGPKSARPSILFVGDLGTRKRGDMLLEVFAQVVRTGDSRRRTLGGVIWGSRCDRSTLVQPARHSGACPTLPGGLGILSPKPIRGLRSSLLGGDGKRDTGRRHSERRC